MITRDRMASHLGRLVIDSTVSLTNLELVKILMNLKVGSWQLLRRYNQNWFPHIRRKLRS